MKIFNHKLNNQIILWSGVILYVIILTAITWYKYYHFGYNALDLAIFNNAFFNAAQGNSFWSSIQGHHYFADHFTPWLYAILPLYKLWPSPLNLLLLQSIFIAITAWPIYFIAKNILNEKWALIIALVWLINPLAWNANLYEWHILPLAIPLLLAAYYHYYKKNFYPFLIFLSLALLVREDVFTVVFLFSFLAVGQKRGKKWIIWPALMSLAYFGFSTTYVSLMNLGASSRFLVYYDWLLTTPVTKILLHLFSLANLEMMLGLSLAWLFLPWLSPRYLILTIGPLAQFMLGEVGGGSIVVNTHYASLFIPGLIIASIWSLKKIIISQDKLARFLKFDLTITKIITAACLIYLLLFLGPGWGIIKKIAETEKTDAVLTIIKNINNKQTLAAGYKFLPNLSSRKNVYSLHYIFTGKQQFSDRPYVFDRPDYIIMDAADFNTYKLQFPNSKYNSKYYPIGFTNIKKLITNNYRLEYFDNQTIIWHKTDVINNQLESIISPNQLDEVSSTLNLTPFVLKVKITSPTLRLYWQIDSEVKNNYFLKVKVGDNDFIRPLALLIPTNLWQPKLIYTSQTMLPANTKKIQLQLVQINGYIELDGWRGIKNNISLTTSTSPVEISL